jgi:hypothetical protein
VVGTRKNVGAGAGWASSWRRPRIRPSLEDFEMRYLLLLHVDESGWPRLTPAEQAAAMAAYGDFGQALSTAGVLVANGRLGLSAGATSIRTVGGKPVVMDGPFAETKEQLGGFYLIEAESRDTAVAWAGRCPAVAYGTVEVREVL